MGQDIGHIGQIIRLGGKFDKRLETAGWFLELAGLAIQAGQVIIRYTMSDKDRKELEKHGGAATFKWADGTERTLPRIG